MIPIKVIPKKWGNSIGITIPRDKLEKANIVLGKETLIWVDNRKEGTLENLFGILKNKR